MGIKKNRRGFLKSLGKGLAAAPVIAAGTAASVNAAINRGPNGDGEKLPDVDPERKEHSDKDLASMPKGELGPRGHTGQPGLRGGPGLKGESGPKPYVSSRSHRLPNSDTRWIYCHRTGLARSAPLFTKRWDGYTIIETFYKIGPEAYTNQHDESPLRIQRTIDSYRSEVIAQYDQLVQADVLLIRELPDFFEDILAVKWIVRDTPERLGNRPSLAVHNMRMLDETERLLASLGIGRGGPSRRETLLMVEGTPVKICVDPIKTITNADREWYDVLERR